MLPQALSLIAGLALSALLALPVAAAGPGAELALPEEQAGPRVALNTNHGRIVLALYRDKAPRAVENFLGYVRSGHYDGTVFHRVIANLLIQGGGFGTDMQARPERPPVASEAANGLSNLRGTVAAARRIGEKDSATAQFFINVVDNPQLDHVSDASPYTAGHTVFGRVVEGMEVVDRIRLQPTSARAPFPSDVPIKPVLIERAEILAD